MLHKFQDGVQRIVAETTDMREKCEQIGEEMETKKLFVGQLVSDFQQMHQSDRWTY
jgi:hypothetical protein